MLPSSAGTRNLWDPALAGLVRLKADPTRVMKATNRVQVLERKVESLETLPERMHSLELQFMRFRDEVRAEFSATRTELRAEIRGEIERTRAELRAEIRAGDEQTRADLRAEIRAGDEETRTYMRVLHEEVLSRIGLLGEHRNGSARSHRLSKARQREK